MGVGQMGGQGTFHDPRIGLFITQTRISSPQSCRPCWTISKLAHPEPPKGSFDRQAANRGKRLFRNEAGCALATKGRSSLTC